ncbi:MAG: ferrous iron transporter B [Candidatus Omnitrophica bacterium]|nr:ferrous iron transporter B [Candidatus Omnitrophota bacterium]
MRFDSALGSAEGLLKGEYGAPRRFIASLLIQEDPEITDLVRRQEPGNLAEIEKIIRELKNHSEGPVEYQQAIRRRGQAARIAAGAVLPNRVDENFGHRFDFILMNPLSGGLVLALILYFGIYQFVGVLGAGVAVDFLEDTVFGKILNPRMVGFFAKTVPWAPLRDLFTGEYGVLTLGLRYAVSLILPIVTFFFLVFSVIEDTGYLPRLAMLLDRIFKRIGLSGRAVIPMVLGFGCATMATLVTRTLPTRRERLIATLLLSLAVPCSAQLGVILAILAGRPKAMMVWAGVVGFVFLAVGSLAARILPGQKPSFYMELPPLRLPQLGNVLIKTYSRVRWYFLEVLPLFLLVSVLIWAGQLTGLFDRVIGALRAPVAWIGLPSEAAKVFLFGFFRRDYGAAGLYDLEKAGALDGRQLVVACVALTLFLPCVAQFLINIKERGWKTGIAISLFILCFAFGTAVLVNAGLTGLGVSL